MFAQLPTHGTGNCSLLSTLRSAGNHTGKMKYGLYLASKMRPEWRDYYIDYDTLKDLIDNATKQLDAGETSSAYSQRVTSLTVARPTGSNDSTQNAHEQFSILIGNEVRASQ